ncbi:hypothetical protein DXG01_006867 [Tephrocybe rancida]|nr:hypothetical protein DXG01_006867 [Tephrocybe rancida]
MSLLNYIVSPRKGRALKYDRNITTIATIVGVVGHVLEPAAKKPNPFLDLEAEGDAWDETDILSEVEADNEFNDREDFSDEEPPTRGPLDEAEEDADSNDKLPVEDDEDQDVYMDDDEDRFPDNEHPSSARAISHKTLANHDNLEQWRALLARARERGHSYKLGETFDEGLDALLPAMLYRVRVKEGYEETAAMVVANKLLTAGTAWVLLVKSIIGRVSCPTWIFIESSNSAEVNKLCANLSDIYPRDIHPIVDDLSQYLHEPFVAPKPGGWVRLNSPPLYHADLVYVAGYNEPLWLEGHKRDFGGQGANGRAGRPSKLSLGIKEAIRLFGADAVKVHDPPINFTYLGNRYYDGFLYHVTHDFEPTVPTVEELTLFQTCTAVEPQDIARAWTEIASLRLKPDDRVLVTSGKLVGMTGVVTSFSEDTNEATVSINAKEGIMDVVVPPIHLCKAVRVTDCVRVVGGAGDSRVGWVIAVNSTELHILEDKTAQTFTTSVNSVAFHHDAQALSRVAPKRDVSWKPFEDKNPVYRRNFEFLGRRVIVIKRTFFKGYKGIIREILADDEVSVELSTLKNDTKLQPLMYKYHAPTFLQDMPPPTEAVIPQSRLPLTPLTPIPAGTSAEMGAAWNPSSRTPNPHRKFPCNPYMEHWRMDEKLRVKVHLHNTKLILHDPGWRCGDFKNGMGIWKVADTKEAGYAKVQLMRPAVITLRVPEIYVTPVRPTWAQEYIIIDDDNSILCCRIYLVLRVCVSDDGSFCDLREKGSKDKKDYITLSTNVLAVVVF